MYHASRFRPRYQVDPSVAASIPAPKGIEALEFSTLDLPPEERFAAWRDVHSAAFDLLPEGDSAAFYGRHRTWDLGDMAFQVIETDGLRFAGLATQARRDPLDHWVIWLFVTGSGTTVGDRVVLENVTGVPEILSLAVPFHGTLSGGKLLLLYIPRDLCRDAAHLLDAASLSLMQDGMGQIFADYMASLENRIAQLQPQDLPELVTATRALLLAAVSASAERVEAAGALLNHALLERARQCVQDNLQNPDLDVPFLLQSLGVSRSRLYRAFEASDGIMHYIQKRRLLAARATLADPGSSRRIFEIAEDFCFNDAAEFSRAFRREFDYSPSEARAHGRQMMVDQSPGSPNARDLADLLRRL